MRKTAAAALVVLGLWVTAAAPAASPVVAPAALPVVVPASPVVAPAALPVVVPAAAPVETVFIGDSSTANFGIAPTRGPAECLRSAENYPVKVVERLASAGVRLDVRADVSCGGARIRDVWEAQSFSPSGAAGVAPQESAVGPDTGLVVGSLGGNTAGVASILKQCSQRLRGDEGLLMPADPVDASSPPSECAAFFGNGRAGQEWLAARMAAVRQDLGRMFDRIGAQAPNARVVLVGYPRLVPADTARCLAEVPGGSEKPFADIGQDALEFLDAGVQRPLDALMREAAEEAGATYVDLYASTGSTTGCDGARRGIGALLEGSEVRFGDRELPWYVHPNRTGRDLQAAGVAEAIEGLLGT
ncbi:SGNH/GDSL hydrolase family protein [Streptomyces sp. NBC_00102]|uniref:SGNH/GDSL hydrolase family protein n=1 Tax=Streptomyces sp. NBC_00102 TaxID=2975652 RepID=UPI00225C0F20|nr:SGNH/GDSL hydrolase family protein [Streptomyces sp. NBC_00102]MCX5399115.1 SGNH/GDSL hydrolase family protein [Streptomyces sp. NBC_00102]